MGSRYAGRGFSLIAKSLPHPRYPPPLPPPGTSKWGAGALAMRATASSRNELGTLKIIPQEEDMRAEDCQSARSLLCLVQILTHCRQVTLVRAALWELTKKLESLELCVQSDRNRMI